MLTESLYTPESRLQARHLARRAPRPLIFPSHPPVLPLSVSWPPPHPTGRIRNSPPRSASHPVFKWESSPCAPRMPRAPAVALERRRHVKAAYSSPLGVVQDAVQFPAIEVAGGAQLLRQVAHDGVQLTARGAVPERRRQRGRASTTRSSARPCLGDVRCVPPACGTPAFAERHACEGPRRPPPGYPGTTTTRSRCSF